MRWLRLALGDLKTNHMNQYITETDYAVKNLIDLAVHEENKLEALKKKLGTAETKYKAHKWDFETSDLHEDFSDFYVMGAFNRMAQAGQEVTELEQEINSLQALIGSRQAAIQSICGAILQIAKQGISVVHGDLANAPDGRLVGSVKLKDIIWQGRNQAIHYEEGNFNQRVVNVFSTLEQENGPEFSLLQHQNQSRAKQIVKLLNWNKDGNYSNDMQSLLP